MDILQALPAVVILAVFGHLLAQAARRPQSVHPDALLMFTGLAGLSATHALGQAGISHAYLDILALLLFLPQPFFLLRLLRLLRPVAPAAKFLLAAVPLFVFGLYLHPASGTTSAAGVLLFVYVAGGNLLAGIGLLAGSRRVQGLHSWRLALGGVGALLLATAVTLWALALRRAGGMGQADPAAVVPGLWETALIGMALAFLLAFAMPLRIRQAAQAGELQRFLQDLAQPADRPEDLLERLTTAAAASTECAPLAAVPWQDGWATTGAPGGGNEAFAEVAAAAPFYSEDPEAWPGPAQGARALLAVPIPTEQGPGVLLARAKARPLFPEQDLESLALLARQTGQGIDSLARLSRERQERRALEDLERFKSRFLRAVGHELGNPLLPMQLRLRSLLRREWPEQDRQALEVVQRNTARIGRLVEDVRTVALLQEAQLRLHPLEVDLVAIAGASCASHEDLAADQGCTVRLDADGPVEVQADGERLGQVLDNLLRNAIKYSPRGGGIVVRVEATPEQACVEVRDEGLGMSQAQLGRLFRPYGRVHEDEQPGIGGTGLGLTIARGIVEAHGGRLTATSPGPDQGSVFCVVLPRLAPAVASFTRTRARQSTTPSAAASALPPAPATPPPEASGAPTPDATAGAARRP